MYLIKPPQEICLFFRLVKLTEALLLFLSIGRVTGRLPKELADEVVGSVLDCFR